MHKLVKARCSKYDKKFLIECREENGKLKAINFLNLTESEYNSVKGLPVSGDFITADNLIACNGCHSRKIGKCSCAKKSKWCKKDGYNFQCIYCNELLIDNPTPNKPKIMVTTPRYDDIGKVLQSMNIDYKKYDGTFDCDILFINCGTKDVIVPNKLENFAKNGGCVYISDLAYSHLLNAFGNKVMQVSTRGDVCDIYADIEDDELHQIIGEKTQIKFDLPAWAIIENFNNNIYPDSRVILRASWGNKYQGKPIMITFAYGKGRVFYTSFHNHAQVSKKEEALLQLLLLKQIGTQSNQTIEDVSVLLGLNLTSIKKNFQ